MAFSPRTWTAGESVTVAKLDTYATNLNETMPAKVTTAGDMVRGTGSGTITRFAKGTDGQTLRMSGGVPTWV